MTTPDVDVIDDTLLCGWVKFEIDGAAGEGDAVESDGEWFVYGYPEQGAGEHQTVLVRAKSSGRITRVKLGIQIAHNTYEMAERLGVVHDCDHNNGKSSSGHGNAYGPLYVDGVMSSDEESDMREYGKNGKNIAYALTGVAPGPEFGWRMVGGMWAVRGPPGCVGQAVVVRSKRTGRRTLVYLTNEVGGLDEDGDYKNSQTLYGFARC